MQNHKLKILAVDDIQDNLITLTAVIQDSFPGATVVTTLSGAECIALARTEDPDVILLDIVMPGMDGFEVCRRLKSDERVRHIPAIFLTALQTDRESRIKALEVGGEAFLSKPLEEAELIAQIRAMAKIKAAAVAQKQEKEKLSALVAERTRELHLELAVRHQTEDELKQNIAALKTLNQNLEETQNQLLQSAKLAAIGQLAAGVAHEINNPLSFVRSNFNALSQYVNELLAIDEAYGEIEGQYGTQFPEAFARIHQIKNEAEHGFIVSDLRQLINESRDGLERVNVIVQEIKDFSRIGETNWQWADLLQGLDSTLKIALNDVKYNVIIDRQFSKLPDIRCIPSQVNQVFMNLLLNAAQSIQEHGHIIIRTGVDGDQVWVDIQDDGCGIEAKDINRIFDPFFTTKQTGEGTGLGLSIAWGIVQRHKGTIKVNSEPGKGTTFRVILPVDAQNVPPTIDFPQSEG